MHENLKGRDSFNVCVLVSLCVCCACESVATHTAAYVCRSQGRTVGVSLHHCSGTGSLTELKLGWLARGSAFLSLSPKAGVPEWAAIPSILQG